MSTFTNAPTVRQLNYAKSLGIKVGKDWTYEQVSKAITVAKLPRRDASGRFVSEFDMFSGHVTTEPTSKRLKGEWLLSWVLFVTGLVAMIATESPLVTALGLTVTLGSVVHGLTIRFRRWWNHG